MNRLLTLGIAGAGTVALILISLLVYPPLYAYYYYPQTNSVSFSMGIAGKQEIDQNSPIIPVTDAQLSQYPQIKEGIQYLKDRLEGKSVDLSSYYRIGEQCSYSGHESDSCYPMIAFKISEIQKVAHLFGIKEQLTDGIMMQLEYNGNYYVMSLYQPDLRPVYSSSLLYGIVVSIAGSIAIWLLVARIEGRRNRENDMAATEGVT